MNIHFYTARIFTGIKIKFIWCADGEFDKLVTEGGRYQQGKLVMGEVGA